ncbi:MAG: hypothetical protein HYX96_00835 [Chloroflexi bacterium]|nr:hypothetical protein [Chloroflexota bacterium]
MNVYNRYILTVAATLLLTAVALTAMGEDAFGMIYTLFIIEALAITEVFSFFQTKTRRALAPVSVVLLAGFLVVLLLELRAII